MIGSKATQYSEQFMTRSGNHSTKGSAKGFGLLGGGEDPAAQLSLEGKRDSLKRRLKYLDTLRADGHDTKSVKSEMTQINRNCAQFVRL